MADEETQAEEAQAASGGMMQKLMMGVGALVLVVIGVVAGPTVMNMISPPPEEETAAEEEELVVDTGKPAIYQSLHPPLVINFKDELGDVHFMQVTLEVMSRDQEVINSVREHTPAIRNALILMWGNVKYEAVVTREGKEQMLADALAEIQKIMRERIGQPGIEAVYFSGLVVQ